MGRDFDADACFREACTERNWHISPPPVDPLAIPDPYIVVCEYDGGRKYVFVEVGREFVFREDLWNVMRFLEEIFAQTGSTPDG